MLENGLREIAGEPVGGRTKRQTIRRYGPAYQRLFRHGTADEHWYLRDLQLDLWWKSRTPGRVKLGQVKGMAVRLSISREEGAVLNRRLIAGVVNMPALHPAYGMHKDFQMFHLDGFDSEKEFLDYFVPNEGDLFDGVLFQW